MDNAIRRRDEMSQKSSKLAVHCAHDAIVNVAELKPNPRNPNTHPDSQVKLLARAIKANGWRHPIVVSKRSGLIVAGHARLMAARQLKTAEAPVDYQDFASDDDETACLIADNRLAELAEMDQAALDGLLRELDVSGYDLELAGFDEASLAEVMAQAAGVGGPGGEPMGEVVRGQVVQLGKHRLMCGDSHDEQDVAALMSGDVAGLVFGEVVTNIDVGDGEKREPLPKGAPNVVMYSGGKDSLAMLLLMREHGVPIDHVVSVRMGDWEWPELEAHHAKVERELGITIEWVDVTEKLNEGFAKYGFPQVFARWCNTLKVKSLSNYVKSQWGGADRIRRFVGIAYDERERLYRRHYAAEHAAFPLVEHKVTEAEALKMCMAAGFDFGGIYDRQHRVSCWCCPLTRDSYILDLCANDKAKWGVLREMQTRSQTPFKLPYKSVYWFEHAFWSRHLRKSESKAIEIAWRLSKSDERIGGDVDAYLKENSAPNAVVFCADGYTSDVLMACERTGRQCRAIDLNPGNIASAIEVWTNATGGQPTVKP